MAEYFERESDKIQNLARKLRDLPPVSSATTKRGIVALLAGDIQRALDKGYTLKEIVGHLKSEGFDFHYDTVRRALPRQTKSRSGKNKPGGRAAGDERATDRTRIGRAAGDDRTTNRATSGRGSDDERARVGIARMRAVAPPDGPGRDAIPPGAFARRPDLKDL